MWFWFLSSDKLKNITDIPADQALQVILKNVKKQMKTETLIFRFSRTSRRMTIVERHHSPQ